MHALENYIMLVTGVYFVTFGLIVYTNDIISAFFFKVIPFFLGAAVLILTLKQMGVI